MSYDIKCNYKGILTYIKEQSLKHLPLKVSLWSFDSLVESLYFVCNLNDITILYLIE